MTTRITVGTGAGILRTGLTSRAMTASTRIAVCALCAVFTMPACNTTNTYTPQGNGTWKGVEANGWLAYKASVKDVREARLDDGTMKVQVDVFSDQLNPQRFNYMFEWFDEHGMKIESATATWQNRFIKPQETITLSAVAPTRSCARWTLKLSDEKEPFTPNN